ncbi:hypothetical protein PHACT_04255 [Pseudohongiella acticola]|jgi:polyisoprenoid-binding protein YceI|uniref:Lipid/polyisoprenoid-binding YceI-like domain-containing protein n=1 Tax=Pseudohongiella acticola TaxID=1524254 RepID=A0A1E8CJ39_9GAMM|nr:YceI family protein [Pseudohongiella acticola]OFE12443.1 hypothetical protein PHACT_04255 [Pseudohongiella acticola]
MKRNKFTQAALAPLLLAASVSAQAATWEIDPEDSTVIFKYSYSDTPYQGEFRNVQATFEIDPLSPSECKIDVTIPIEDLYVGDEETKSYMFDIELFDVDQFPTATFVADQCEVTGVDSFTAKGMLTIRDQTHPIDFPFDLDIDGMRFNLTSEVTVQRLDYGVGQGYFANTSAIPNDIVIEVDVYADMLQ